MQPLEDIRVLDLSRVYAAPAGAMILGDLGADVIRVEPPEGSDSMRDWGPFINGQSTYYLTANRNKRSMTIDFNSEEDRYVFFELVRTADVVIENFKTGTLERLGIDYQRLKAVNQGIILCSVTGFGHTGPLSSNPGFDPVVQAMSGLMSVTGHPDGEATKVGIPISDILTSVYVALSVVSAIRQRDKTGKGQEIDLALLDVQLASMANIASSWLNSGDVSRRMGNQHNNVAPYQVFRTADDDLMICAGNDHLFTKLATILGKAEWAQDNRFKSNSARKENENELVAMMQSILEGKRASEWIQLLSDGGIPAGRINSVSQAFDQDQAVSRGAVDTIKHHDYGEVQLLASPLRFSGLGVESRLPPPRLGEHDEEIRNELKINSRKGQ